MPLWLLMIYGIAIFAAALALRTWKGARDAMVHRVGRCGDDFRGRADTDGIRPPVV